jgi:hypothetical protein
MNFREVGWGMDWIHLAQEKGRWWTCECGNTFSASMKCGEFLDRLRNF